MKIMNRIMERRNEAAFEKLAVDYRKDLRSTMQTTLSNIFKSVEINAKNRDVCEDIVMHAYSQSTARFIEKVDKLSLKTGRDFKAEKFQELSWAHDYMDSIYSLF